MQQTFPTPDPVALYVELGSGSLTVEAADTSESWVQERRLKLSEPTEAHWSSITQTFACT